MIYMKSHFLGKSKKHDFISCQVQAINTDTKHYKVHTKFRSNSDEVQSSLTSVICTIGKKFLVSTDYAMR